MFKERKQAPPGAAQAGSAKPEPKLPPARPPQVAVQARRTVHRRAGRALGGHVQAFAAAQQQATRLLKPPASPRPDVKVSVPKVSVPEARRPAPREVRVAPTAALNVLPAPRAVTTQARVPQGTQFAALPVSRERVRAAGVPYAHVQKKLAAQRRASSALARGFVKRGAQQVRAVRAQGQQATRAVQVQAARAGAQVSAAASAQGRVLRAGVAAQKARVLSRAAAARAGLTARRAAALAALPQATQQAQKAVQASYDQSLQAARTDATTQKQAVQAEYARVTPMYLAAGDEVGAEAQSRAEAQAAAYESHVTGQDDSLLDGPLTDNRWKARAGAARDVGAAYAPGFREQAQEEAQHLTGPGGGLEKDLKNIDLALRDTERLLREHLTASTRRLTVRETQARAQATQAYAGLSAALQAQLTSTLRGLDGVQGAQLAAITAQAAAQRAGLNTQAKQATTSIGRNVTALAGSLERQLHAFDAQVRRAPAPNPKELAVTLNRAQAGIVSGVRRAQLAARQGTTQVTASLSRGAAQAGQALGGVARAGVTQAGAQAGGFDQGAQGLLTQALTTFRTLTQAHARGTQQDAQQTTRTLDALERGLETLYAKALKGLPEELRATLPPLREGLRGNFPQEDAAIRENAEKAAAQVQPRWKGWVKIALMIAVIIVVAVVAGPAVIGAVGAMAGALGAGAAAGAVGAVVGGALVGAASGAVIQMANNAVDNIGLDARFQKSLFDGVGKAALIGAVGGALGGAGGLIAGKMGAAGLLGSGLTQKAGTFAVGTTFDLGGNVLGDVMNGASLGDALKNLSNPETLMMMAIGTGVGAAATRLPGRAGQIQNRAHAAGERVGLTAGDRVNNVTGNPHGTVPTRMNPELPTETPGRISGHTEGRTKVELSPNATPQDAAVHDQYARQARQENSPVSRLTQKVKGLLGADTAVRPGTRQWELGVEAAKHQDMAHWRFQEADRLPKSSPQRQRLLQEAHDLQRLSQDYQQAAQRADGHTIIDDSVIEGRKKLYDNHAEIEGLLGKPFDASVLPDRYVTFEVEGGRKVIGRLNSDGTYDMKSAILLVRPDGTVQVNPSNRITYDYIQKYQLDPGARPDIDFGRDGHTLHHLIPDKVSTSNSLCVKAMELIQYSPDRMTNYHEMPMERLYRLLDGQEVGHWSHHNQYDAEVVIPALQTSQSTLVADFGPIQSWTPDHPRIAEIRAALQHEMTSIEAMLKQRIVDGNIPMTTENTAGKKGRIR
ncbi:AHH domain-containing protein [Deinococcus sedimenti]|nr:AHH domain-containing protein [Deinococcus sedimenti]